MSWPVDKSASTLSNKDMNKQELLDLPSNLKAKSVATRISPSHRPGTAKEVSNYKFEMPTLVKN